MKYQLDYMHADDAVCNLGHNTLRVYTVGSDALDGHGENTEKCFVSLLEEDGVLK